MGLGRIYDLSSAGDDHLCPWGVEMAGREPLLELYYPTTFMNDEKQSPNSNTVSISMDKADTIYSNMCRGVMTAEEVILDFALNPNINGRVLDEPVGVTTRVVMSFPSAKRLLHLLHAIVSKHEETFGEVPLDVNQRLQSRPTPAPEPAS